MPTIVIKAEEFADLLELRLRNDRELLRLVALEVATRGEAEAVIRTNKAGLVDERTFKDGWSSRRTKDGAELGNEVPYASVIEYGRRPGRPGPPLEPIREWVVRKLVGNGNVKLEDADNAAFLIRRAIHQRGTPPRHILLGMMPDLKRWFRQEALRRLRGRYS